MSVSRETQLAVYRDLLARWGKTLNLTSTGDRSQFDRHVADSLTLVPHLPTDLDRLIDFGSGQGYPAIPLAIETGCAVELIESDRRKAAFLTTVLATLGLAGTVWPRRIEAVEIPPARCITARALSPLPQLIELARPFLAAGGCCLFIKGSGAATELAAAVSLFGTIGAILPGPLPPACLVKITALG